MTAPQDGQLRQSAWTLFPQLGQGKVADAFPSQPCDPVRARANQMRPNTENTKKLAGINHMKIMPIQPNEL